MVSAICGVCKALSHAFFKLVFIRVWLLYNVASVSTVQQSDSAICVYISPLFLISSHLDNHRALSRVPCVIQQVLISCLFYTRYQSVYTAAAAKLLQSCPTLRPQRWQPTRLPCPQDSPGKNTGVGCHFLLQCMKVKNERELAQLYPTLRNPMDCSPPGFSVRGIFQAGVLEWVAISFSSKCICVNPNLPIHFTPSLHFCILILYP